MDLAPTAILAAALWAYWANAMQRVRRARRRGRSAGLVPGQPCEIAMFSVWLPIVILWLGLPLAALVTDRAPFGLEAAVFDVRLPAARALRWTASGAAIACFLATRSCWRRMGRSWRMAILPGERTELVTTGPYAVVRHPIYALSILLMGCSAAVLPTPTMLAIACVHAFLMVLKARREERHLAATHGDHYRDYERRTGGFLPRLRPWRP
jgi:protein-S-isoprenylcysteine O-methyltransferase Ste14